MKASMKSDGTIVISPENGAEAFALQQWVLKASIPINDQARGVDHHLNPAWLMVIAENPEQPS